MATLGQAMEIIKQIFPKQMDTTSQIAVTMLRQRRSEVGDQFDAEIDDMLALPSEMTPIPHHALILKAEALEVQGKQDESIAFYEKILKRDDFPVCYGLRRKTTWAFFLLRPTNASTRLKKLINRGSEVYGPSEDILDTRAVVRMAGKNYDGAVEDMELATSLSRDPLKFYHRPWPICWRGTIKSH